MSGSSPSPVGRGDKGLAGIRTLFPSCARVFEATPDLWEAALAPAEEPFIEAAVPSRQREFRAGRACARGALRALGVAPGAIPVGSDRAPIWPAGVVGSITHTRGYCAAVVGLREDFGGLGIDAECRDAVGANHVPDVCTTEEIRWIEATGSTAVDWSALLFSAKESLYKALHPMLGGVILDFHDASVPRPPRDGSFWIQVAAARRPAGVSRLLRGSYLLTEIHVITGLGLSPRYTTSDA